jgi:hypothetical protein
LTRRRHDGGLPARSRDLSQAITAQTMLKIVTTNPIAASGPGQPRTVAAADFIVSGTHFRVRRRYPW